MFGSRVRVLLSAAFGAIMIAGWRVYRRRSRERIESGEGLDDPEVARGFGWVATMPPMRLLRWFVARRVAAMVPQGQAVDLGCGPGHLVIEVARRAPGLHVSGLDLSDEMLAQARDNARHAGLDSRASFRSGDAGQIPFPDSSLDLVVSTLSLHHWSDPVAVLDEVARVLRPGGSFLIIDLRRDMGAPAYLLLWFATHAIVPAALRRVNEPLTSRNAAYTLEEAAGLAARSRLEGWCISQGLLWLTIEGSTASST
jgi:ubiquinone/menaquinone biosynthesis C-methylase UbiE